MDVNYHPTMREGTLTPEVYPALPFRADIMGRIKNCHKSNQNEIIVHV
jgi:hypothetical protein